VRSRLTAALLGLSVGAGSLLAAGCGEDDKESRSKIGEPVVATQDGAGRGAEIRQQRPRAIGYPQLGLRPPVGVGDRRAQCTATDELPTRSNLAEIKSAMLCLHNAERRARGLGALRLNDRLSQAAQAHAADMVRSGYFGHQSRRGITFVSRIRSRGFRGFPLGENIAAGDGDLASPTAIVADWMRSAGHRSNILNPRYKEIGIGVFAGFPGEDEASEGGTYVTTFGTIRR
jgi:uncharacterized protein YkwD